MKILQSFLILVLLFATTMFAVAEDNRPARLTGVLAHKDGRPLAYGFVYLFDSSAGPPPVIERYWRIPNEIFELDEHGRFDIELPAGTYYLAYIKHSDPYDVGPPKKGETILVSRDSKGNTLPYVLVAGEVLNIGTLSEAVAYDPAMASAVNRQITAIEGRIVSKDGKPVAGVPVFAFTSPAAIGRPLFTSERSDSDGRFLLRVDKGGTYYLKVRGHYGGGQPGHDSVLDGEKGEKLAAVEVETGQVVKGVLYKELTQRGPKSKRKLLDGSRVPPESETGRVRDR